LPKTGTPKLIRITTVPISLKSLLTGQMRYMRENGFDVLMISADGKERVEVMRDENCPHRIVPMTRAITPFQDLKCLWQLIKIFRKKRPGIVHSHTPKAGLLGMLAAKIAGVPVRIHTVAGMPLMTTTGLRKRLLFGIEMLTYWAAQQVWPNSRSLLQFIREHRMAPESKLQIISNGSSNGVETERFSASALLPAKLEAIKRQIRFDESRPYLLAVGRVVVDKGIGELVGSFLELKKEFPNLNLILLGPLEKERPEETLPTDTLTIIENHPHIVHIHWSDDVEYFLRLATILVHPSYREGFPNVLLQAGAMQCPIVCSAITGNVDVVEHERTGLLFEAKNQNDLTEKLRFALEHPAVMHDFSERLRKIIEEKFDRKAIHEKLYQRYLELLKKHG
jgi:glycosyltransferase involved in cell wall biosynthesis